MNIYTNKSFCCLLSIATILIFTNNNKLYAQQANNNSVEIPNILLPSPTASELGKFALIGNSLSTGTVNTHIELLTYKTKNLSLPISLEYSSNGLKVDMISSRVGMDWSLNAGGVVSRTVYGSPDESRGFATPPADFPNTTGTALKEYLSSTTVMGNDTQPDIFTFSFGGYSGKFIIYNNVIKKFGQNNLLISGDTNEGFIIKTPDGIQYSFTDTEYSTLSILTTSYTKIRLRMLGS